jgi:hypothetical protein
MAYELVGSGVAGTLEEKLPLLEGALKEGDLCELRLTFRSRFPGSSQAAWLVDWTLSQAGVTPWPGETDLVFLDPVQPAWYVRWVKGFPWLAIIVAGLLAVVAVMAYLTVWQLLRVVPEEARPWVAMAIAGGVALAGLGLLVAGLRGRSYA